MKEVIDNDNVTGKVTVKKKWETPDFNIIDRNYINLKGNLSPKETHNIGYPNHPQVYNNVLDINTYHS